ncbi:MAG: hypothetical protein RIF32_15250 [Leptospirales bacterium]|jgi:hypothetical protein
MEAPIIREGLQSVPLFSTGEIAVMTDAIEPLRRSGDDPEELVWWHSVHDRSRLHPGSSGAMYTDLASDRCVITELRLKDGTRITVSTLEDREITLIYLARRRGKPIGKA